MTGTSSGGGRSGEVPSLWLFAIMQHIAMITRSRSIRTRSRTLTRTYTRTLTYTPHLRLRLRFRLRLGFIIVIVTVTVPNNITTILTTDSVLQK